MKKSTLILVGTLASVALTLSMAVSAGAQGLTDQVRGLQVNTPAGTIDVSKNLNTGAGAVNVGGVLNVQNQVDPTGVTGGTVVTPGGAINVQENAATGQKNVNINGLNVQTQNQIRTQDQIQTQAQIQVQNNAPGVVGVDINNYGAKLRVESGATGATVTTPGVNVVVERNTPSGANTLSVDGLNIKTSGGAGTVTIIRDDSGKTINISPSSGKLERQISIVSSDPGARQAVVNLSGNSQILIQDGNDLGEYAKLVVQARPSVTNVDLDGARLTVEYKQPAKFLGLFSTKLGAQAIVDQEKGVTVSLPWYSFLFKKNTKRVKAAIVSGIASDQKAAATISAEADQGSQALTVQQQARTINVVTSAVDSDGLSVNVGAGVSVNSAGASVQVSQ